MKSPWMRPLSICLLTLVIAQQTHAQMPGALNWDSGYPFGDSSSKVYGKGTWTLAPGWLPPPSGLFWAYNAAEAESDCAILYESDFTFVGGAWQATPLTN